MINCDRCGGTTTATWTKPRKTDGKTFQVYECNGTCMNGKWKYSCFPPKPQVRPQTNAIPQAVNQNSQKLDRILKLVEEIHIHLNLSNGGDFPTELRTPDEEGF